MHENEWPKERGRESCAKIISLAEQCRAERAVGNRESGRQEQGLNLESQLTGLGFGKKNKIVLMGSFVLFGKSVTIWLAKDIW